MSTRLVHLSPNRTILGVWQVEDDGSREAFYKPFQGQAKVWEDRAAALLDAKGSEPTWLVWQAQLVTDSSQYWDSFSLVDAPEDEPLEATMQRLRDEALDKVMRR